jgi:Polysaccharide deacetylase
MCRYKLINNFIPQTSITIIILLSIFAHAAILGSISTPSYAYSPCRCVIFVMDDVNDSTYRKVQLATMDYFLDRNLPFTAGIIVSLFANNSNLDVFNKVEEGVDRGLFEIAIHGNRHVNHAALSKEEQLNDLSFAKGKLEYLFGKRADIFIPPGSEFNLNTIEVMADLNITLLSSSERSEQIISNPYKNQTLVVTNSTKLQVSKIVMKNH